MGLDVVILSKKAHVRAKIAVHTRLQHGAHDHVPRACGHDPGTRAREPRGWRAEDVQDTGGREHCLQRKDLELGFPWSARVWRDLHEANAGLDA